MDRPIPLVRPGGVGEQPGDGRVDLAACRVHAPAEHGVQAGSELGTPRREVLSDVVKDLSAEMAGRLGPAGRGVRRFDRIADVLAVPFPHLADDTPVGPDDAAAVGLVGPNLFAADEELGGTVDVGEWRCGMWGCGRPGDP